MIRFVMDRHLGRLAKWMRTLGYDAFFDANCPDAVLVDRCASPEAFFVTTRSEIAERIAPGRNVVVPKEPIAAQLRLMISFMGEDWKHSMFSRCVVCNIPVEKISKEAFSGQIPEKVYHAFNDFTRCPSCRRIYWKGSHTDRLQSRLLGLLNSTQHM